MRIGTCFLRPIRRRPSPASRPASPRKAPATKVATRRAKTCPAKPRRRFPRTSLRTFPRRRPTPRPMNKTKAEPMMLNLHTIENGKTILLSGDSVTDCGRARLTATMSTGWAAAIRRTCTRSSPRPVPKSACGWSTPASAAKRAATSAAVGRAIWTPSAPTTRRCSSASTTFGGTSTPI